MDTQITIADVAKYAGVSTATAGRVVGGYGNVSEKSREKVLKAVKELNYRPNVVAQSLRRNTTNTIAVILGSIKNNYCNKLIYAIEKEAQKHINQTNKHRREDYRFHTGRDWENPEHYDMCIDTSAFSAYLECTEMIKACINKRFA